MVDFMAQVAVGAAGFPAVFGVAILTSVLVRSVEGITPGRVRFAADFVEKALLMYAFIAPPHGAYAAAIGSGPRNGAASRRRENRKQA